MRRRRVPIDPVDLLEDLVRIPSVNPRMEGGVGEQQIAEFVASVLGDLGLIVSTFEVQDGRSNVVARLDGEARELTLLLEAHLDTVAASSRAMVVGRDGNRLIGRGACDTKASVAAMIAALSQMQLEGDRPSIVFAGVVDEEYAMSGSRALVKQLDSPPYAAIVGEPTSLRPVRVHNGLARLRIETHGRAAHTSKSYLGANAITSAARVVIALEDELHPQLLERGHPLIGPALITAAVIHGGTGPNVVPEACMIEVDRRLAPGEEPAEALAEIDRLLDRLRTEGVVVTRHHPNTLLPAVETPEDHPVVRIAEGAVEKVLGSPARAEGAPFGTDASNLWGIGRIPCVVLGPGSIDQAHTEDEWVPISEVRAATAIYSEIARAVKEMD
jgi:acetylornithine deacetylase/succinyl-diaminopimelate desuccinylase-like protein